jgi:hypothetical protein
MWRLNSMLVTLGWRLVNLGNWMVRTFARNNNATSSGLLIVGLLGLAAYDYHMAVNVLPQRAFDLGRTISTLHR